LMRGTGPRGLAGMAGHRPLGTGQLCRPFLRFSRAELECYAREQQLTWVNDESNADDHYDRNFLRNQIMPRLYSRWPALTRKWQQTAELCAANETLLEEVAAEDLRRADEKTERTGRSLALKVFDSLSQIRQQNMLRYWLMQQGYAVPEHHHWQQIYQQLATSKMDAQIDIRWGNVSLRVYRDRLYCLPQVVETGNLSWNPAPFFSTESRLKTNLPNLHIRYRQGGERCKPEGRAHSQTLKKLLQDYGLEPWLRDKVPLLYSDETLVAVGDLWICAGYRAGSDEEGLVLCWQIRE
jgi:tRNA(Ile)-lysidine synthase